MTRARVVEPSPETIVEAVAILRRGGLVAFPTETVYGLGGDARERAAIDRIFIAKGRPADHPLIVHIASAALLEDWATDIPNAALRLADAFWPGPLTMILRRNAKVLDAVTGGQDTIGLRVPSHPVAQALLRAFGDGIAAPSANRFGHVSPTTAAHVLAELSDSVDLILDGGACEVGIESTIVDLSSRHPRILRPGHLGRDAVETVLGVGLDDDVGDAPRVSGALASHYAPRTPVRLLETSSLERLWREESKVRRIGVIALETRDDRGVDWRGLSADPTAYAKALYAQLRALDERKLDLILIELPPPTRVWEAVRDRLTRAAGRG